MNSDGVTLLWAVRSPCHLRCRYCYFGAGPDPGAPGQLSYDGSTDASLETLLAFIASLDCGQVRRVFLAGGEPLYWRPLRRVVAELHLAGVQTVLCTNGIPLADADVCRWIVSEGVAAVSVSLDSHVAEVNDALRIDARGVGWRGVVDGLRTLSATRGAAGSVPKIGVYMVVTRQNLDGVVELGRYVAALGLDYFIVQPVSLLSTHPLHEELCLTPVDGARLQAAVDELTALGLPLSLPDPEYLRLMFRSLDGTTAPVIPACFGGRDLFFIEPDGSVWDCPSVHKIATTPLVRRTSIVGRSASEVFSLERRGTNTNCTRFSQDCVNMWQLMAFDALLAATR